MYTCLCGCAGLIEIREFMARFVDQVPDVDDLEAAFADPTKAQQHMQVGLAYIQGFGHDCAVCHVQPSSICMSVMPVCPSN